ncbi:putative uncharacterized protein [Acinetobacter sp. CAG:196]|nr:putative uncharacterized protein [Acinetobacter sp. CAG:196]
MRLRDYQKLLAENIPLLKIEMTTVTNNGSLRQLTNYVKAMKATHIFEDNNLFIDLITSIKNYEDVYNNNYEPFVVNMNVANDINNTINSLSRSAKTLKNTIDNILATENENCVYFKLPEYENIDELAEFFNTLKLILKVFNYIGEEPKFNGFDMGSEYVLFCFAALPYLVLLYQIADKSLALRNKKLEGDKTVAEIEKLKSEKQNLDIDSINKIIQSLKDTNEEELSKLKDNLIEEIISIAKLDNKKNDGEFKNLLSVALEKSGLLLEKGMKLIPALTTSQEIMQLSSDLDKHIKTYQNAYIGIREMRLLTEQKDENNFSNDNEP